MTNPAITENDNTPIFIGDQLFESHTILAGENPAAGQVLGAINLGDVSVAAGGADRLHGLYPAMGGGPRHRR